MMNRYLTAGLALVFAGSVAAQDPITATITFRVKSDFNEPVAGVEVRLVTIVRWEPGEASGKDVYDGPTGKSDAVGLVTLSVPNRYGAVQYSAHLDGYYPMEGGDFMFRKGVSGAWEPPHPTIDIVMKPILNPTPVAARRLKAVRVPAWGKPIGFDLLKSDWVAPYGKGEASDFIFFMETNATSPDAPFLSTLTLRFSNPGDGIQSVMVPQRGVSRLRLPRFAPESGYLPEIMLQRARRTVAGAVSTDESESQNYFFRIRTQMQDGKILSALYGKISGNIEFWENGEIRFAYYLNPEPLSRNMEFDLNRNLFRGLRGYEVISEP